MIVEDEVSVRDIYSVLFRSSGYEVIEARDGQEACEKFTEQPCSMVITDMNMPRMNGMELTETLRVQNPDVYIIMITGYGTAETHKEAFQRGVNDYITKPFDLIDLRDRVHSFFAGHAGA